MKNLRDHISSGFGARIKLKPEEYLRVALILVAILSVVVLMALEIKQFSNTFGAKQLVVRALLLGVMFGVGLSYYLTRDKLDQVPMDTFTKFQLSIAVVTFSVLLMPFFVSFTNRKLSFRGVEEVPVTFVKSEGIYSDRYGLLNSEEPDEYYLFVLKEEKLERLKTEADLFPEAVEGEQVLLPVKKGLWGFEVFVL